MPYVKRRLNTTYLHIKAINSHLSPLRVLRSVHGLRDARSVLELSQSDMGAEIGRVLNCQALSQSTIANVEAGLIKLQREYIDAVGILLATWITDKLGRRIGTKVFVNSPWRVVLFTQCDKCLDWFELERKEQTRCKRHGGKR